MASRTALALVCALLLLQSVPDGQSKSFEVASIRRSDPAEGNRYLAPEPGGRLRVVNLPVTTLVWMAYGVQSFQVVDGPAWAAADGYDIVAKAPDGTAVNMESFRPMLQTLLADRFQLKLRRETRDLPIYNLVLANRDKALGTKLKRSAIDCTGNTPPPADPSLLASCGAWARPGGFSMGGMPIRVFTRLLSPAVSRVIVDQTQLAGTWDLEVSYTPDLTTAPGAGGDARPPSDSPTLFTALREQLGLNLEPGRGPVEVLVIESVARPTEN